jgi:selenoprotein W-related protein
LTAKLLPRFKTDIKRFVMVPSKGGCFELSVGGKPIYSKLKTGEFPKEEDVIEQIAKALGA